MEYIKANSILSKLKNAPDSWFGITYNMNLYRGCQHQCIYCDSRSECYQIADLSKIQVKQNAIELLHSELKRKKIKATIGTGSMNDPYMPIEKELNHTRKALEVIDFYKFPIHIITKSNLVKRDSDLIHSISKTYAAVTVSITTTNPELAKIIEPGAPTPTERLETIKHLAQKGIYCGIALMPVLPFITDTPENISDIVQKAAESGAQYIIPAFGVTLRDKQREYFYNKLDLHFKGASVKYSQNFHNNYMAEAPNARSLYQTFNENCNRFHLKSKMEFYVPKSNQQLNLF